MSLPRRRWPAILLVLISIVLVVAIGDVAFGPRAPRNQAGGEEHQSISVKGDGCGPDLARLCEPYSVPDPLLGFTYRPGRYAISIAVPSESKPLVFETVSEADGARATSSDPAKFSMNPAVWVFGCSMTWGFSVDWDKTYPSLLQAARPDLRVRNLAGVGYGNTQALLQLRDLLEVRHEPPPKYAVFAYTAFHPERNVASPVVLRRWGSMPGFKHPRAALDAAGKLVVDLVTFDDLDRPPPTGPEARRVTMAVFDALLELTKKYGITPILAVQSLSPFAVGEHFDALDDEPVVKHLRDAGMPIADILVDHTSEGWNNLPWDGHPNERAHAEYARKLLEMMKSRGF